MLEHFFKVSVRNLKKNKVFTLINVISLSFALACCIIAYLNYNYRNDFNHIHTHTEQIYRINTIRITENGAEPWGVTPVALSHFLMNDADTSNVIVQLASEGSVMKANGRVFNEEIHYANKSIFNIFNLPLKEGSLKSFNRGTDALLSEELAVKYFGADSPIGESFEILKDGRSRIYSVAGVLKSMPEIRALNCR